LKSGFSAFSVASVTSSPSISSEQLAKKQERKNSQSATQRVPFTTSTTWSSIHSMAARGSIVRQNGVSFSSIFSSNFLPISAKE